MTVLGRLHKPSMRLFMIVLVAVGLMAKVADADREIVLKKGAIGPDAAFIVQYLSKELDDIESNVGEFYVGRYDLNMDGKLELIVVLKDFGYCGSAGCLTSFFEKVDESWQELAWLYVHGPSEGYTDRIFLNINDEGERYLTVYGYHIGLRWDGMAYRWFCIGRECDRPEWRD